MAENSKIEWTHHTFNPWRGCTKVSDGCKFCYADELSKRNPKTLGIWGPKGSRSIAAESYWKQASKWNREAGEAGERRRVFCSSLADVFEGKETMPAEAHEPVDTARARLAAVILDTPHLDWLLLTKRPENAVSLWAQARSHVDGRSEFPPNVWVGTSIEDMRVADRADALRAVPCAIRFLSCEPLIGSLLGLDLTEIGWVIVGGESGGNARPFDPAWAYEIKAECERMGLPYFFKQMGDNDVSGAKTGHHGTTWTGFEDLHVRQFPSTMVSPV